MEDYYKQLAESIFANITERIGSSKLVVEAMESGDEVDASAAAEVIDRIHLSELASALNGNYALARVVVNGLQHSLDAFVAASKFRKLSPEEIRERIENIFVETVGTVLKQMDGK